ncbi:MAG: hypothetical protein KF773_21230 [Deltaproteobacteria bacterium]|nr:hypothetical protein [Deltaproteobacteria bacterium]
MRGVALVLAAAVASAAVVRAQPDPSTPELGRARELYLAAEAAVAEGRFDDAARDYGAAYEISKDPVLFFKIASANERARRCEVAIIYYRRYLKEGRPDAEFTQITNARIVGCGGTPEPPRTEPATTGSAGSAGSGRAVEPGAGSGSGSDAGSALPPVPVPVVARNRTAWVLVGGSLTFVTIGAILAYAANASEADIADLYVGLNGQPPVFDARTEQRYRDLFDEGKRYERLAWLSFGLAGAFAAGAAVKFLLDGRGKDDGKEVREKKALRLTPTIVPGGAGAAATIRF